MDRSQLKKILNNLESGYDQVSKKFSGTRSFFWKDLAFLADYVEKGDLVLDYGCGNGRLLDILEDKEIGYQGVDVSGELISLAKQKYPQYGDNFQKISSQGILPFSADYFNKAISIAVFHHFPVLHANVMARELYRVTKPGGVVIITAWYLWQKKYRKYIFNKKSLLDKLLNQGKYQGLGLKDIYIPFRDNQSREFDRYHRAYTKKDLCQIFSQAGFHIEECRIVNGKNILLVGRK